MKGYQKGVEVGIFDKRINYKPFEYPEVLAYVDAINHAYWLHSEFSYISDVQDFKVCLSDLERVVCKRTLLAISQIEVDVKTFWGDLYKYIPKPEFNDVGSTFAESEVRHSRTYAHLIDLLGLNHEYNLLMEVPCMKNRIDYLKKNLVVKGNPESFITALVLFTLLIENVSLFSQFAIIRSFNHKKNLLVGIDNAIQATAKEEVIHGMFGAYVVKLFREEYSEFFTEELAKRIVDECLIAYEAEWQVLDWIFEEGELDFVSINAIKEFIKYRLNESLEMIGFAKIFEVNTGVLASLEWFLDEVMLTTQHDFFYKRPTSYTKRVQAISSSDIF